MISSTDHQSLIRLSRALVVFLFLAVSLGLPATSWAVLLTYEADLALDFGSDPSGLAGSHVVVELTFDSDQQYVDLSGVGVEADAVSASLTVTNASEAASNGTFSTIVDGGIWLVEDEFGGPPTFFMGRAGNAGNQGMIFDLPLGDIVFSLFGPNAPDPIPSPGDLIQPADFPATGTGSFANRSSLFGGTDPIGVFRGSNEQLSAIPEPASLVLLGLGCLALLPRRQHN